MNDFETYGLDDRIVKILAKIGYKEPTPIQNMAIPKLMEGVDLIASAQTGTGKTAAFLLPTLHKMLQGRERKVKGPRALILVPTRELAIQVAGQAEKYSKGLPNIKTVCIYGGIPYPIQKRNLARKYDILVATPGRLIDLMEQRHINLSEVEVLVLDEADRMLDMGFIEPVEKIARATPDSRQTLLFSATIDKKIANLSENLQKDPFEIKFESEQLTNSNIEQKLYYVDCIKHKMRLLDHFLENVDIHQAIVFTATKRKADEIAEYLYEKGHRSGALHGDMNQRQRTRTIGRLRLGNIKFLVATDVAARGIDVLSLSHVINFDLPSQSEDFVHRIGRTGRAGREGVAISFATYQEESKVREISKLTNSPMNSFTVEGLEPKPRGTRTPNLKRTGGKKPFATRGRQFGFNKDKAGPSKSGRFNTGFARKKKFS